MREPTRRRFVPSSMPDQPDPAPSPNSPVPEDRSHRHAFMHGSVVSPPGFDRYFTPEELMAIPMEEIEANGYNLNISRYISTAQAEKEVDLQALNAELLVLAENIEKARERHNAFLKELGLPGLP